MLQLFAFLDRISSEATGGAASRDITALSRK
jgi:hypothetical protein